MSKNNETTIEEVKREAAGENKNKEQARRMQLIIFKLGAEEYALPIDQIKEVVLTPRIAKMPQTLPFIKGVANIRGNIIAIIDLEQRFGVAAKNETDPMANYTLVVESELYKVGILVKEVPNTLTINEADIDKSSNFIHSNNSDERNIQGVVKAGERLIILVDIVKLMEYDNIHSSVQKALS